MLQDFLTDFNTAKLQSSLIPKGTIVKVKMAIKPGGYECWFTRLCEQNYSVRKKGRRKKAKAVISPN